MAQPDAALLQDLCSRFILNVPAEELRCAAAPFRSAEFYVLASTCCICDRDARSDMTQPMSGRVCIQQRTRKRRETLDA